MNDDMKKHTHPAGVDRPSALVLAAGATLAWAQDAASEDFARRRYESGLDVPRATRSTPRR